LPLIGDVFLFNVIIEGKSQYNLLAKKRKKNKVILSGARRRYGME
jgi:hypothetical protein